MKQIAGKKLLFYIRPRELNKGEAERCYKKWYKIIDETESVRDCKKLKKQVIEDFNKIPIDKNKIVPKVYLLGEFFVLLVLVGIVLWFRSYIVRHIFTPRRKEIKYVPNVAYENIEMKVEGGFIRGWLMKSEGAKGCFLLIHGWSSNKSDMLRYAGPILANGYDVLIADVPGHGESDANVKQVSIKSFVQTILALVDYVESHPEMRYNGIYVLGHSIGGTAASIVNATDLRIRALITDSMPTSLKSISQSMAENIKIPYVPFGWLFVSWFLLRGGVFFKARKEWRLEEIIKNQKSKALAIHSILDQKVPITNVDVLLNRSNFRQVIQVRTKGHHNCVADEHFWNHVFHFIENNEMKFTG